MNIHSLLHALGLDLGSNHGIRRPATVPSSTQHVPIPSSLSDERIAAIEGARRRMPVSLTPTSPQGFRRIDTDRRGVPRQLQDLDKAPSDLSRWHGERDHSSFYSAVINATCGASVTPEIVSALKQHVIVACESRGNLEVPEELRAPIAASEGVIATVCACLGLNVVLYVVEDSSTTFYPEARIEQGPYVLLIRESGMFSVVRSAVFVHGAILTMRRHSEFIRELLSLQLESGIEPQLAPHPADGNKRHIEGRGRSPAKILRL